MEIRLHSTGYHATWRSSHVLSHVTISVGCSKLGIAATQRRLPERVRSADVKPAGIVNCVPIAFWFVWNETYLALRISNVWIRPCITSELCHYDRWLLWAEGRRRGCLFPSSVLLFGLLTHFFHFICQRIHQLINLRIQNHCCLLDLGSPIPTLNWDFSERLQYIVTCIHIARQRLGKCNPATHVHATIVSPLLGNGLVNCFPLKRVTTVGDPLLGNGAVNKHSW